MQKRRRRRRRQRRTEDGIYDKADGNRAILVIEHLPINRTDITLSSVIKLKGCLSRALFDVDWTPTKPALLPKEAIRYPTDLTHAKSLIASLC